VLGWVCAAPIHAGQSDFGVGLGLTYDSNIGRSETNPQREWIQALIGGFAYQENTIDVTARVLAQVEKRHYYRDTNVDDTGGIFDGSMVWNIRPRQLAWTVEDVFQEILVDITAPNTPSNLTKANALNTGPDFTLLLGSTNKAVIGGRYGRIDIKNSNRDTQRYTAYVRGLHMLSPQTTVSLNYEAGRVYFEPGAQTFEKLGREDLFGRFENRSALNSTAIDLGASRVAQSGSANCDLKPTVTPNPPQCNAGPNPQGVRLARVALSQVLSAQSTLRASLSDQISDTYTDLIAVLGGSALPTDGRAPAPIMTNTSASFVSGDSYRSRFGSLAYVNNSGHFVYTLQAYERHVDFLTLDQDFNERAAGFVWSWLYSGGVSFNASAAYTKRHFDGIDREDTDRIFGAGMVFRLNRNVTITMQGSRIKQQSTEALSSYTDNRVVLLLGYSSGPTYQVQSRR
jgi:hypothetical protein